MDLERKIQLQDILRGYGSLVAEYYGEGVIFLFETGQSFQCNFGIGQIGKGENYLIADITTLGFAVNSQDPDKKFRFNGVTEEGFCIFLHATGYVTSLKLKSNLTIVYSIEDFIVKTGVSNPIKKITFGLTNFIVSENYAGGINFTLPPIDRISIRKIKQYEDVTRHLKKEKNIEVTSEIDFSVTEEFQIGSFVEIASTICCLLSICRGTKIFWIYYRCYDEIGNLIFEIHVPTINHPYASLPELIPSRRSDETIKFLQDANSILLRNTLLKRDLIIFSNVFTDARNGEGYLESQGIKVVIVMEVLVKYILENPDFEIKECISDNSSEGRLIAEIKGFVDGKTDIDRELKQKVKNKMHCVSRTSFRDMILKLCEGIRLNISESDSRMFVNSRNSLIHSGKFYNGKLSDEQRTSLAINSDWEELRFLINFCDRVFLRLFGYSGPYANIRKDWASNMTDAVQASE
jgi:hypothetical protein